MGVVKGIGIDEFPEQGTYLGRRVRVCFNYQADAFVLGTCIRDDNTAPYVTIFQLDDGRAVLSTECQYN